MLHKLFDPHFAISTIFDGVNLTAVHFVACLLGSMLALYVMQLWSRDAISLEGDCWFAKFSRRIMLGALSLTMLWSLAYSTVKGWEPWPPDLFALLAIDGFLISNIIVAVKRKRGFG